MLSRMLAVLQFRPDRGERAANLARLVVLVRAACEAGARFVVLPEMAATGYRFPGPDAVRPLAEPALGPTFEALSPLAREHGAHLVCGFVEHDGARLFNAAIVIGPDGEPIGVYRKRYLYVDDTTWAAPGNKPFTVFETPQGRAIVGICMDINGHQLPLATLTSQASVVCLPTNWVDEGRLDIHDYWADRMPFFDGTFLGADRWGTEDGVRFWGRSAILHAGRVVAAAPARGDGWLAWSPESDAVVSSFSARLR